MELPHLIHLLTDHLSNMHLVTLESILQERFMLKIFLVITKKKCLNVIFIYLPQREKCPHLELFWSAFSRIWTEYGEILPISPYLVWMPEYLHIQSERREMRTRITPNTNTFCTEYMCDDSQFGSRIILDTNCESSSSMDSSKVISCLKQFLSKSGCVDLNISDNVSAFK